MKQTAIISFIHGYKVWDLWYEARIVELGCMVWPHPGCGLSGSSIPSLIQQLFLLRRKKRG